MHLVLSLPGIPGIECYRYQVPGPGTRVLVPWYQYQVPSRRTRSTYNTLMNVVLKFGLPRLPKLLFFLFPFRHLPPLQRQRQHHLLHTFTTLLLLPTLSTLYTSTPSSSFLLVFAASPTTSTTSTATTATTWNTNAADGMNEKEFFVTAYLGTYCGAFGGWLLILGSVALYCRYTASSRRHGLNQYNGSVNFESFEQSMIVKVRKKKRTTKFLPILVDILFFII